MKTLVILTVGIVIAILLSQISPLTTFAFIVIAGGLFVISKRLS